MKDRAMAPPLVLAVASDCQVRLMRQSRKEIQQAGRGRSAHLSPVTSFERPPGPLIAGLAGLAYQALARGNLGQPHVVEVPGRVIPLRHASWRASNGTDAETFSLRTRTPKLDETNPHGDLSSNANARAPRRCRS